MTVDILRDELKSRSKQHPSGFFLFVHFYGVYRKLHFCLLTLLMTLVSGSGQCFTVYEPCPPHFLLIAILSYVLSIQTAGLNQTSLICSFYCTCWRTTCTPFFCPAVEISLSTSAGWSNSSRNILKEEMQCTLAICEHLLINVILDWRLWKWLPWLTSYRHMFITHLLL